MQPETPWARSGEEVASSLAVDPEAGLSEKEAARRLKRFGPNRVDAASQVSGWSIFIDQFKNFIVLLLAVAAGVSFAIGQHLEGGAILIALGLNVCIGFCTEFKARRSMEALEQLTRLSARVLRDGEVREISADHLVPGDVVELEAGDMVPADVRLVEANRLMADESSLTGESEPVGKSAEAVPEDAPLAERSCMLFKSTSATMGSAHAVAAATGGDTEIGRISRMTQEAESEQTPLQRRLDRLGRRLVWLTVAVAALVGFVGLATGMDVFLLFETAVALAVAAIPEGLPIVATIALAKGMWRMADRNALINHLGAVETLGSVNELLTDKTGTLTENRMRLSVFWAAVDGGARLEAGSGPEEPPFLQDGREPSGRADEILRSALRGGVLCNNASLSEDGFVGDPLEAALLEAGRRCGLEREKLLEELPEVREEAFDPELGLMATVHEAEGGYLAAVKGAPETVLSRCSRLPDGREMDDAERRGWLEANERLAGEGLRVLALARRRLENPEAPVYEDLELLGLAGLLDPPRQGVEQVVADLDQAGVRVVMVTGDHAGTALNIAMRTGVARGEDEPVIQGSELPELEGLASRDPARAREIAEGRVFARVSPEQKIHLASLLADQGRITAMTGDGVNDAPALKRADIGVAMGKRGTQVAREASDMVLADDDLASVVTAVRQGRIIFENIRRFLVYLLSGNVGEILLVGAAMTAGLPLPLLPLQILYLNMISDVFPALALGVGAKETGLMLRPPRDPGESLLTRSHWRGLGIYGAIIAASSMAAFLVARGPLDLGPHQAVTVSFLGLAFGRTWHVFNMRRNDSGVFWNEVTRNPWVWAAVGLSVVLLLAAVMVPPLSLALRTAWPGAAGWLTLFAASLVPLATVQAGKAIRRATRSTG